MPRVRVIKVPAEPAVEAEVKPVSKEEPGQRAELISEKPAKDVDNEPANPVQVNVVPPGGIVISKKILLIILAGVLVLILLIFAITNRQNIDTSNNHQADALGGQSEAKQYENEVRRIVDIPEGSPSVYRKVDDAEKLAKSTPTIFKNAQNGDVLMMYLNQDKTGKVVLYRPSTKKIIVFIDGVDLGSQSSQTKATQSTQ